MSFRLVLSALPLVVLGCAPLSQDRAPAPTDPRCRAAGAQAELGKTLDPTVTEAARAGSGALRARVIKPGDAVTMDADPQRLNIEVDDTGKIHRLRCG